MLGMTNKQINKLKQNKNPNSTQEISLFILPLHMEEENVCISQERR